MFYSLSRRTQAVALLIAVVGCTQDGLAPSAGEKPNQSQPPAHTATVLPGLPPNSWSVATAMPSGREAFVTATVNG